MLPAEAPPETTTLRFAVLGELAQGGMGRIDLARRVDGDGLGALVAVKRLHPHLAKDEYFVRMFMDEACVTGALDHPNVVRMVGWGEDEEGLFLATEFVFGASLSYVARAARAKDEAIPEELVALIAAGAAEGLAAAHTMTGADGQPLGIVHRDVSPGNVLVGFDGTVKIADFGIAKATASSAGRTATGILKGKVPYMSPEYARGRHVDGRSDLWSLGIVMYELLSGARPFDGPHDAAVLTQIMADPVPPLAGRAPSVDGELASIVEGLLAKDPNERPTDGMAVRKTLLEWLKLRGLHPDALTVRLAQLVQKHAASPRRRILAMTGGDEDATVPFTRGLDGPILTVHTELPSASRTPFIEAPTDISSATVRRPHPRDEEEELELGTADVIAVAPPRSEPPPEDLVVTVRQAASAPAAVPVQQRTLRMNLPPTSPAFRPPRKKKKKTWVARLPKSLRQPWMISVAAAIVGASIGLSIALIGLLVRHELQQRARAKAAEDPVPSATPAAAPHDGR